MICFKCGKEIDNGSKYCSYCGEMIIEKTVLEDNAEGTNSENRLTNMVADDDCIVKNQSKRVSKKSIIFILTLIILILASVITYQLYTKPLREAKKCVDVMITYSELAYKNAGNEELYEQYSKSANDYKVQIDELAKELNPSQQAKLYHYQGERLDKLINSQMEDLGI